MLPKIQSISVKGKVIFVRTDTDVPISSDGTIDDETRLASALPTLKYLLHHGASLLIAGHMGRPKGLKIKELSLKPVAEWFSKELGFHSNIHAQKLHGFSGWKLHDRVFVLENLRYYVGEEANDRSFAKQLAELSDIYVNDAFAVSHRSHASIVGIPRFIRGYAGIHLQQEVETLGTILQHPKRPLVVIIGGAKIETKLPLVEKMHQIADYILVGGKIAQETRTLLHVQHERFKGRKSILLIAELNEEQTDITAKSVENFLQVVRVAQTIVWNGPVGKTNNLEQDTEFGTRELAMGITHSGAHTIVGGGDTLGYLQKIRLLNKFDFVSTGGGAMLSFLSGEKLPGLEVLKK